MREEILIPPAPFDFIVINALRFFRKIVAIHGEELNVGHVAVVLPQSLDIYLHIVQAFLENHLPSGSPLRWPVAAYPICSANSS
jgi:hypothetical protein